MSRSLHLGWRLATLKNGLQDATAYRWEFVFEVLGSAFVPAAIQWVLWSAMYVQGGNTTIAGLTYGQMIQYTMTSLLFSQIRGGDYDFELAEMIRSGQLSNYLLRPVSVIEFVYIRGVAPKLFIAAFALVIGCVAGHWLGIDPFHMMGAMVLALMGNIIHYQISAAIAASSFLWEEAYSMLMVKNMVVSILSGELLPLTLFPAKLAWIWKIFPFYLYVFGPTQFALGRWSTAEFTQQMGMALLWLGVGWVLIKITWGLGTKKYLSLGG